MMKLEWIEEGKDWKAYQRVPRVSWLEEQYAWRDDLGKIPFQSPEWLEATHHWKQKTNKKATPPPHIPIHPKIELNQPQFHIQQANMDKGLSKNSPPQIPQILAPQKPVSTNPSSVLPAISNLPSYEELGFIDLDQPSQPSIPVQPLVSQAFMQEELFLKQALEIANTFLPQPLSYAVFVPPPMLSHQGKLLKQLSGSFLFAIHSDFLILATLDRSNKWAFNREQIAQVQGNASQLDLILKDGREISILVSKFEDFLRHRLLSEIEKWLKKIDK
jgi:hypothetical protein